MAVRFGNEAAQFTRGVEPRCDYDFAVGERRGGFGASQWGSSCTYFRR